MAEPTDRSCRQALEQSIAQVRRRFQREASSVEPPPHVPLLDDALPYWHSVMGEKGYDQWTLHERDLAAMLARTMAHLEAEQRMLMAEGRIANGYRGAFTHNPRGRAVNLLLGQVLAMRKSLGLTTDTGAVR